MTYSACEGEGGSRDGSDEFVLVAEAMCLDLDIVCHGLDGLQEPNVAVYVQNGGCQRVKAFISAFK